MESPKISSPIHTEGPLHSTPPSSPPQVSRCLLQQIRERVELVAFVILCIVSLGAFYYFYRLHVAKLNAKLKEIELEGQLFKADSLKYSCYVNECDTEFSVGKGGSGDWLRGDTTEEGKTKSLIEKFLGKDSKWECDEETGEYLFKDFKTFFAPKGRSLTFSLLLDRPDGVTDSLLSPPNTKRPSDDDKANTETEPKNKSSVISRLVDWSGCEKNARPTAENPFSILQIILAHYVLSPATQKEYESYANYFVHSMNEESREKHSAGMSNQEETTIKVSLLSAERGDSGKCAMRIVWETSTHLVSTGKKGKFTATMEITITHHEENNPCHIVMHRTGKKIPLEDSLHST